MTDSIGYIYILRNDSHQDNVYKIGYTKNLPELRAKQLYSGKTGVPQPFKVKTACKVGDYKKAEKVIHKCLKPYRINSKREFFELPFEICESVMLSVCNDINSKLGLSFDNPIHFSEASENDEDYYEGKTTTVKVSQLIPQCKYNSTLNEEQKFRVGILMKIVKDIYPCDLEEWMDGFMKDYNPEKEIKVWEAIARAYIRLAKYNISKDHNGEILKYLLMRTWSKKSVVLKNIKDNEIPLELISKILDGYDMKPRPITINRMG